MSECFENARELGRMVLQTELADRVRIAQKVSGELDEMALSDAQSKFDEFFNQVVDILKATVTGEIPAAESRGCGGGCCSSKH